MKPSQGRRLLVPKPISEFELGSSNRQCVAIPAKMTVDMKTAFATLTVPERMTSYVTRSQPSCGAGSYSRIERLLSRYFSCSRGTWDSPRRLIWDSDCAGWPHKARRVTSTPQHHNIQVERSVTRVVVGQRREASTARPAFWARSRCLPALFR